MYSVVDSRNEDKIVKNTYFASKFTMDPFRAVVLNRFGSLLLLSDPSITVKEL